MEWKNYIQSIIIGTLCIAGYIIIQHINSEKIVDNIVIQSEYVDNATLEFESDSDDDVNVYNSIHHDNLNDDENNLDEDNESEAEEHQFYELPTKIFVTAQERQNLFDDLGIQYLQEEKFDYAPAKNINARLTEMYLDDPEEYEALSYDYKDDVDAKTLIPMSIKWLGDDVGYGIFAEKDLLEDDFIGVYTGSIQDRTLVGSKDYAWLYPIKTENGDAVSLDGYWQGNELRFINDGVNPNCIVKYIIGTDNLWHICYVAQTDIQKGEQLLISYGPDYWDTRSDKYQELA